jgi:hypothetical protein
VALNAALLRPLRSSSSPHLVTKPKSRSFLLAMAVRPQLPLELPPLQIRPVHLPYPMPPTTTLRQHSSAHQTTADSIRLFPLEDVDGYHLLERFHQILTVMRSDRLVFLLHHRTTKFDPVMAVHHLAMTT